MKRKIRPKDYDTESHDSTQYPGVSESSKPIQPFVTFEAGSAPTKHWLLQRGKTHALLNVEPLVKLLDAEIHGQDEMKELMADGKPFQAGIDDIIPSTSKDIFHAKAESSQAEEMGADIPEEEGDFIKKSSQKDEQYQEKIFVPRSKDEGVQVDTPKYYYQQEDVACETNFDEPETLVSIYSETHPPGVAVRNQATSTEDLPKTQKKQTRVWRSRKKTQVQPKKETKPKATVTKEKEVTRKPITKERKFFTKER